MPQLFCIARWLSEQALRQLPQMLAARPPARRAAPAEYDMWRLPSDRFTAVLLIALHLATLYRARLNPREQRLTLALIAAWAAQWCLVTLAPRLYVGVRAPLVWILRLAQGALYGYWFDVLNFFYDTSAPDVAPAATLLGSLGAAATAAAAFFIAIVWVPGIIIGAFGMQLPPGQHLVHALLCTVLLGARAVPGKLWPFCCCAERQRSTRVYPSSVII
jgi:hypothetical protein